MVDAWTECFHISDADNGLDSAGYLISIVVGLLYLTLTCILPDAMLQRYDEKYVSIAYVVWLIFCGTMVFLTALLIVGLMKRSDNFIIPWLGFSIATVPVGVLCVIIFINYNHVRMSFMVLVVNTLSWYPIFHIMKTFRSGQQLHLVEREIHQTYGAVMHGSAEPSAALSPTVPYSTANEVNCTEASLPPPPGDEVLGEATSSRVPNRWSPPPCLGWQITQKE